MLFPGPIVRWVLPSSKTDPSAATVTREWGCLCVAAGRQLCPAHLAAAQLLYLLDSFGDETNSPDLPFAPSLCGAVVSKAKMQDTFEALLISSGRAPLDALGRRAVGGHSARVTGARFLANLGLEVYKIALLARWQSDIVIRYVSDSPLRTVTADCRRLLAGTELHEVMADIRNEVAEGTRRLDALDATLQQVLREEDELRKAVAECRRTDRSHPFVLNLASGAWHRVAVHGASLSPLVWRTACAWKCASAAFRVSEEEPPPTGRCDHCFPPLR